MEAARSHLRLLFNPETGEVADHDACPVCERRELAYHELERKHRGTLTELGKVRQMLVRQRKSEVRAEQIYEILDNWRTVCMKQPDRVNIIEGSPRWEKVRARMEDVLDREPPHWMREELLLVPEGGLLDPWLNGTAPKKVRENGGEVVPHLDATTLYRDAGQVEKLVNLAQGFRTEHGCFPSSIPERVLRNFHFEPLLAKCDFCNHLRLEHSKGDPARDGAQACLVHGCDCDDGSWYDDAAARWLEHHR
jgi:hypothetical protein